MLKFVALSLLVLAGNTVAQSTYGAGYGTTGVRTVGASTGSYGAGSGSYGSSTGSYGSGSGSYGAGSGSYGAGSGSYGAGSGSYGANRGTYGASAGRSYGSSAGYVAQPAVASYGASSYGQASNAVGGAAGYGLLQQFSGEARQGVVNAAVQQLGRTVEYRVVPYNEQPIEAQVVEVEPSDIPLHLHFKSRSSTLSLSQSHTPGVAQEAQVSSSQDEPSRLVHEIQKPVIQEVREVITPYRQVTQEIQPVVEAVHTVVTKADGARAQYQGNVAAQYLSGSAGSVGGAVAVGRGAGYTSSGAVGTGASQGVVSSYVAPAARPVVATSGSYTASAVAKPVAVVSTGVSNRARQSGAYSSSGYAAAPIAVNY